jgi:small-conductance mechanosensitive channel
LDLTLRIFLIAITTLIAIIIGLLLRRWLIHRLKNTVLDSWIVETFGILIILPPLILAAAAALFILENGAFDTTWDSLMQILPVRPAQLIGLAWYFIETVLIIVLGVGIARTFMRIAVRGLGENRIDINIRTLIGRIFYIITLIITIFLILAIWQVAIVLPVAVLGTLTVAIVFAIQDILKDLVAGFYILLERPFHIGDQITIGDEAKPPTHTGVVEDVQIRATKLRIVSGEQVTVPNSLIFGGIVINNSFYGERRATISVTLPQEEFVKDETADKIIKALKEIEAVIPKPEPAVLITGYTGNSITLTVRYWVANRQQAAISEVVYSLRRLLPNADLAILEPAGNI